MDAFQSLFGPFIRHSGAIAWAKDRLGRYVFASPTLEQRFGFCVGFFIGKTDMQIFPESVAGALRINDQEVLRARRRLEFTEEAPDHGGRMTTWFVTKFPLPVGDDMTVAGLGVDITRFRNEARDVEGTFQQILNAITDMVMVKGPGSRIQWANSAFLEMYGLNIDQLKGMVDAPFVEPDYTQKYIQDDLTVFNTGRSLDIPEEPLVRNDGRVLSCHTVKSPIFDSDGKVIKTVGVSRDITERKRMEFELGQAQRLESIGRIAAGVAHEINTPIQFVGDQAQFLRSAFDGLLQLSQRYSEFVAKAEQGQVGAEDLAAVRRAESDADLAFVIANGPAAFDAILDGTSRISRLVQAMKEFGHPDSSRKTLADINRAMKATLTISANELKYVADVQAEYGDIPQVLCYVSDLNQVFLNLLVNAAHAIADAAAGAPGRRGIIRVVTRRSDGHVEIAISDTGCGIPDAIQAKIFDPFFTTKAVGRGTGQGLAIARTIVVEKHGGTLSFETKEGRGTTFLIRIPVAGE